MGSNRIRRLALPRTRTFAAALALGFAALLASPLAAAQGAYPSRTIKLVVDASPGGITDLLARLTADSLAPLVGRSLVVENRPGATGNLAVDYVVKSPADGYTLLMAAGGNLVVKPFLERSLPFDVMTDLVPVFNVAEAPHILVVPGSLPVKDLGEFIRFARTQPGKISYGSAGTGSPPHIAAEHFARLAGLQAVHVPYKGVGPTLPDLIAGRLQMVSMSLASARPYLKGGQLKPLAAASKRRLSALPEVPTSAEAGLPGWEMTAWFGLFAPKGTSAEIVRLLNTRMQAMLEDPKTRQKLLEVGAEPLGGSEQAFAEQMRADYRMLGQVVKELNIKMD